ncbi:hypothetical protein WOLCODRAFT_146642 [Wolfiporia cocos MD-104 SS10]|uniref:Uncharacterized protein n=1 Tax=Wolfiporia cocos (strain MD-104) TaxID=742152 RepID=A0A2H3JLD9_WOLCO|nr:hypothetical protein WOLCODRAFT_146642 [Wolfiporia cocos MD-104 SS10]
MQLGQWAVVKLRVAYIQGPGYVAADSVGRQNSLYVEMQNAEENRVTRDSSAHERCTPITGTGHVVKARACIIVNARALRNARSEKEKLMKSRINEAVFDVCGRCREAVQQVACPIRVGGHNKAARQIRDDRRSGSYHPSRDVREVCNQDSVGPTSRERFVLRIAGALMDARQNNQGTEAYSTAKSKAHTYAHIIAMAY